MDMSIQRTVSEILEGRKNAKYLEESDFGMPFEEEYSHVVILEDAFWKVLVEEGINPEDYPDKTLTELLESIGR